MDVKSISQIRMALTNDAQDVKDVSVVNLDDSSFSGFVKSSNGQEIILCAHFGKHDYHQIDFDNLKSVVLTYQSGKIQEYR